MGRYSSIGASAAVAAVVTHGMVFSALNFHEPLPVSTYQRFFQHVLLATERLWSYAHGWQPLSHIRDFGAFYAPVVHLICPLIGFAVFWIISRPKLGLNLWKPLPIALLLTIPPCVSDPWVETARTILILLLMVWSLRRSLPDPARLPAPASL